MKKEAFFILAIFLISAGSAFCQEQGLLLDDFEGAIYGGPDGSVDFGAGGGSSVNVAASPGIKTLGSQSLKVSYDAVSGGYMWVARGFGLEAKNASWLVQPAGIDWKAYKAISFYMYGANSKAKIAFDIKDSGNEIWRYLFEDDFTGWKQILCPFADFFPRSDWQPQDTDKNANLDFPLKSFQFEPRPEAKGEFYFDKVELLK